MGVRYRSNDITESRSASEPIMYGLPEMLHRREEPVRMHADIIAVTEAFTMFYNYRILPIEPTE